jgi:hypothetical protein
MTENHNLTKDEQLFLEFKYNQKYLKNKRDVLEDIEQDCTVR